MSVERISVQAALDCETCGVTRKLRYVTEWRAVQAVEEIRTKYQGLDDGRPLPRRAYACRYCGGWHITSKPHYEERPHEH